MDNLATLINIRNTLDAVEVKGRDNMNKLLGCIMALENIIAAMKEERKQEDQG